MASARSTPFIPGMMTSEKHEVISQFVVSESLERSVGIADPIDLIPEILKQFRGEAAYLLIVFDDQDAVAAAAGRHFKSRFLFGLCLGRIHLRKIDREGRPLPEFAGDQDFAARLLDETERLAQPETRSLSDFLCREERLENRFHLIGRDSGSGVDDRHCDEPAGPRLERSCRRNGLDSFYLDGKLSFAVHGVSPVHRKVHEGSFELGDISHREAGRLAEV
jgi:hypothetical protein